MLCFFCRVRRETTNNQATITDSTTLASATNDAQDKPPAPFVPADSSFTSFISLFEHPETPLPEWAISFLNTDNVGHYTSKALLEKNESIYVVLYDQFVPVGPGMNVLHVASFSKDGSTIGNMRVGTSYPSSGIDGGGKDYKYEYYDTDRHVLAVSNSSTDWDENTDGEVYTEMSSYYLVGKDGQITNGRKFPEISSERLDPSTLTSYSSEELKIMRNEIFASYGYIFKTEPMKSYYNAMPWYTPSLENVDMLLNDIEKWNIKTIKEAENQ